MRARTQASIDSDTTVADLVRARRGDVHLGIAFEEHRFSWDQYVCEASSRAQLLLELRRPGPFHVGYLSENTAELTFWLAAGALAVATMVGVNPTRRGAELARDIRHTDCQLVLADQAHLPLLDDLDIGVSSDRVLVLESEELSALLHTFSGRTLPAVEVRPTDTALLLFT